MNVKKKSAPHSTRTLYTKWHMPNDREPSYTMSSLPDPSIPSAFALKQALKQSQTQVAQERLFEKLGKQLFDEGWSAPLTQWLIDELCQQLGASHGLIAEQHAGALKIIAKRGDAYPVGARIPMLGALGQWLKAPLHFAHHTQHIPSLWTLPATGLQQQALFSHHFPIAYQQQAVGLLSLITANSLSASTVQTCYSVCGLLGFALKEQPSTQQKIDDRFLQALTPREREVFALLPSGASNSVLASKLGISAGTVKIHVERILSKLGVADRTQAAVKAVEAGFKSDGLV